MFVATVLVDGDSEVMRKERLANAEFIILSHNMMPELLKLSEMLACKTDYAEALLQDVYKLAEEGQKLNVALDSSTATMDLMREQIEQMRGMFNDHDGAIQAACDAHDDTKKLVLTCCA